MENVSGAETFCWHAPGKRCEIDCGATCSSIPISVFDPYTKLETQAIAYHSVTAIAGYI